MVSGLLPERLSHPPFYIEIHFVYKRTYWYVCYRSDRNHVVELAYQSTDFQNCQLYGILVSLRNLKHCEKATKEANHNE